MNNTLPAAWCQYTQGDRTQSDGGDGRICGPQSRLDSGRKVVLFMGEQ